MGRRILEREQQLAELADAARQAADGRGCVVLVSGEAGIGKSSLVDAVRGRLPAEGRMLLGHCDDLSTARTLGPLRDLIGSVGTELTRALRDGEDRDAVLAALYSELDWPGHPTLLAVEDVHWADDATLDVLRYLGRRISQLPAVLLLTYRDDEPGDDHRLPHLLGMLAGTEGTRRLPLPPLSEEAVQELSKAVGLDGSQVFAVTSGNPFFVNQVLVSGRETTVPETVVDAVLDRMLHLDSQARVALEQLAVIPSAIERELVDTLVEGGLPSLVAAEERGLLKVTPTRVSFRHELTRRAIADRLPAARRTDLHRRVLAALVDQPGVDVARIVHHAGEAGDVEAIVQYGPAAARDAASSGAHREAAAHFRLVLDHAEALPLDERAACSEEYAIECYLLGNRGEDVRAAQEAVRLRRSLGDPAALGAALRWLSRMEWWNGERRAAESSAREAVSLLEPLGESRLLALAYSNQAQLEMLGYQPDAVPTAERAVALARAVGDDATLSHALNNLGTALWRSGDARGRESLEESLRVALRVGETDHVCRAYTNMAWQLLDEFNLDDAERYLRAGLVFAEQAEQVGFWTYLHIGQARVELHRGHWDSAVAWAETALDESIWRCPVLAVQGRALARQGDPLGSELLRDAVESGQRVGELQWSAPAVAAAAEAAWLGGDNHVAIRLCRPVLDDVLKGHETSELWSELGYWMAKAGSPVDLPKSDRPYALLTTGRWQQAAEHWRRAGCPYEYAMALTESSEPDDLLTALEQLDALGATPLARITRRRLRDLGISRIPRGPAATTRENPAGLTGRQLEVLRLLVDGRSNSDIATELVISVRTAENHVSAVLDKLGVSTRAEAVAQALDLGLVTEDALRAAEK